MAAERMRSFLLSARHAAMTSCPLPPPLNTNLCRRRILSFGVLASLGLAAVAQPAPRRRRIVFFHVLPPDATSSVTAQARFREALREHGFVDGGDYEIRYVWEERIELVAGRIRELLKDGPDLVVTLTTPVALAAAKATREVPIVFGTVSDPVGSGLVVSLGRPGRNVTGIANVLPALSGKLVELAREILPSVARMAVLWNPENPAKALELRELRRHAERARIELQLLPARSTAEIEAALLGLRRSGVGALVVLAETLTDANRDRIAELALANRLPSLFNYAPHVHAGGLVSYSQDYDLQNRRLGELAGKILAGAQPGALPVEQPTRFLLVLNMRTARALGIAVPQSVLVRADEVIE